jgi:glycosyltransferase involved in cell wall biosynthesis
MVSILLATYNGSKYIKKSIQSIINQTYAEWELLVGINGTTDNTEEIVKSFSDSRIKIYNFGDDKGKAKTLNKLLKFAKFEFIAIQDDDDIWLEDKLENQIKYANEFDVIGTLINYIDENDNIIGKPNLSVVHDDIISKSLNGDNQVANTSAMVRKDFALAVNGWSLELDGIEDYDFWLRLIRENKKFINVDKVLVLHRLHRQSNFNTKQHNLKKIL